MIRGGLSILVFAAGLLGCFEQPDVGPPLREACVNDDSDPSTSVSFSQDIFAAMFMRTPGGCLGCHAPNAPTPLGFEVSGLDLSTYDTLRSGGQNSGTNIIVPGQPCDSILFQKVSEGVPFGARMPLNGPPFFNEVELQVLSDWIAEGAIDN